MFLTCPHAQVQQERLLQEGRYITGSSRNRLGARMIFTEGYPGLPLPGLSLSGRGLGGGASEVAGPLLWASHLCVYPGPAVLAAGLFPQPHLQLPRLGSGKEKAGVNQKKWTLPWKHSSNLSGSSPSLEWVGDNNTKFAFELAFPGESGNKP